MRSRKVEIELLRRRISRMTLVVAYARPPLIAFLRAHVASDFGSPRLLVRDIICGGRDGAPLFRFTVDGDAQARSFVAPLSQLSFGRSVRLAHPLSRK
ncbi:MAG: hypothetical protein FJX06_19040, partial [Alphaproteobacteria bacterium]|nr:hypothetical protein [Alphaproteobacteria bacterium]